ncbi:MAG: maleylpyruvate isomerase N-terminal domain-containing protein [Acidimicrobiales bacterium]
MPDALSPLQASTARLAGLVQDLGGGVERRAYPSEWTIADVMSHLGSGAVIFRRRVEDSLEGRETPEGFNESIWTDWNAKSQADKATDALAADAELMAYQGKRC